MGRDGGALADTDGETSSDEYRDRPRSIWQPSNRPLGEPVVPVGSRVLVRAGSTRTTGRVTVFFAERNWRQAVVSHLLEKAKSSNVRKERPLSAYVCINEVCNKEGVVDVALAKQQEIITRVGRKKSVKRKAQRPKEDLEGVVYVLLMSSHIEQARSRTHACDFFADLLTCARPPPDDF